MMTCSICRLYCAFVFSICDSRGGDREDGGSGNTRSEKRKTDWKFSLLCRHSEICEWEFWEHNKTNEDLIRTRQKFISKRTQVREKIVPEVSEVQMHSGVCVVHLKSVFYFILTLLGTDRLSDWPTDCVETVIRCFTWAKDKNSVNTLRVWFRQTASCVWEEILVNCTQSLIKLIWNSAREKWPTLIRQHSWTLLLTAAEEVRSAGDWCGLVGVKARPQSM